MVVQSPSLHWGGSKWLVDSPRVSSSGDSLVDNSFTRFLSLLSNARSHMDSIFKPKMTSPTGRLHQRHDLDRNPLDEEGGWQEEICFSAGRSPRPHGQQDVGLPQKKIDFWPKLMWPPQSSDLNPLDYSVWWRVESSACNIRLQNVEKLKAHITENWDNLNKGYVVNVCRAFRGR